MGAKDDYTKILADVRKVKMLLKLLLTAQLEETAQGKQNYQLLPPL